MAEIASISAPVDETTPDSNALVADNTIENENISTEAYSSQETPENLPTDYSKVLALFKDSINLPGYSNKLFQAQHESAAITFLSSKEERKLVVFLTENDTLLSVQSALPSIPIKEIMYYIKQPSMDESPISELNFEARIQYGAVTGDSMDSLLRTMKNLYLPLFLKNSNWPESIRKEFQSQIHRFMAMLTDITFQLKGHTVLYVPNEDLSSLERAAKSKDVIQRLESLLVHWTRQIKEVVNNQHTSESTENSGPLEEINFWKRRCDDLSGISEQLNSKEVIQITSVLELAKSSYLDQFLKLSNSIQEGTSQAQDNLRYLSTLTESCQALAEAEPSKIPLILPKLLMYIRLIWANSKHYNTKERMTNLLRKVSNEIIKRCCAKISLEEVFHGDVQASTNTLLECISCGEAWKAIYKKTSQQIYKFTKLTWDFDQSSIFAQIDAFVQRCRDLIEVCEGQIQFARKLKGGKKEPIPIFGGSHGLEIAKGLEDIEVSFSKHISNLWNIRPFILDVKATRWHDDYNHFKQGIKDLEVMMQNLMNSAFEGANNIETCIPLLEIFHHLAKREAIKRGVEKKTADIYQMFIADMNSVKADFELHRRTPEILRSHPDYAGSAFWARSLLRRVTNSMAILQNAYYLPKTSFVNEAKDFFEALVTSLEEYINKNHADWVGTICPSLEEKLGVHLMVLRGEFLEIQFDKDLLRLFSEISLFLKMKSDVPFHVQEVYSKKEELRVLRENVLLVVRDYNSIVKTLTREEHFLFRERIRFLDKKIKPGLKSLTWDSKGISDYFVKECLRHSHDVQKIVSEFLESKEKILKICEEISRTLLWNVESKRIYELEEFKSTQEAHRNHVTAKIVKAHDEVKEILEGSFQAFKNDGKDVYQYWVKYIEKIDEMVEDALRITFKKSLSEISKAINGEGKNREGGAEVHALFKVNVVLEMQKVDFNPTLKKLEDTASNVAREMITIISVIPRLSEVLAPELAKKCKSMYDIIANEEDVIKIFSNIQTGMASNSIKCQAYLRTWDSYKEIWEINKDAFIRRYAKLKPALSTFDSDINRYNEVANNTQKEETLTNINFTRLDCSPLKHALVAHCNAWQNKLTTLLNSNASTELHNLYEMFDKKSKKLKSPPNDLEQLSDSLNILTQLQSDIPIIEAQFGPIHDQYAILEKYEVHIKPDEKSNLDNLASAWGQFQLTLGEAEKYLQEIKSKFKNELLISVEEFVKNGIALRDDFSSKGPFNSTFGGEKALKCINDYRSSIASLSNTEKSIQKGLDVFKLDHAPSKELENLSQELDFLTNVWVISEEWSNVYLEWKTKHFLSLDSTQMEETVQSFVKRLNKMSKDSKNWDVFSVCKDRVNQTKRAIPLLIDLKNPALRPRHWKLLMDEVGKSFDPTNAEFSLDKIMDLGLDQYTDLISTLSASATKELSIEEGLKTIAASWASLELDIVPYKDDKGYYKIRSTDPIFELLEDNQVTISSMKASKFYLSFEKDIDYWEKCLFHVVEVVDILLQVQKQWMYLENIFVGTEDIRKQLPKESSVFDIVNKKWKEILDRMQKEKLVLNATQFEGILDELTGMNIQLEKIQKSLDMYLETKRQSFPRFYFLSNDDLLEILGQAKDPSSVQPHLKKCFDNLYKLELLLAGSSENRRHNEAVGMHSGDGEYVPFNSNVIIDGPVESWLLDIEAAMRVTLRKLLGGCLSNLKKAKKDKWLKDWPGMLLITAGLISWTADCTKALNDVQGGDKLAMRNLKKKQMSGLKKLAELVKTPLNKVDRKKLIALITIEVHSRDVIERMSKANCDSTTAFEWLCQLRYYWDREGKEEEDCFIKQINTHFRFGYEYLGNSGRLVITPLTDRCFMTLTTALHLFRGGSPQGPAGTGKTETVKDLGKNLGKYVIVQNCSESLDYISIGRMFSGVAQTGAWGCFDEFNRIDIEVLSVVALQISCILNAISRNLKLFVFEGKEIKLNVTCGIFITMNPGYAGRVELPDNLKALFRPVSMMVPDSALIAEIMLFAEGFSNTKTLSKKVDTLYRLSIQQLSKQDHYDFGLRALTSALRSAGGKKRQDMAAPDEVVLYLAMKDNNVPKLTAEDTPLFYGILSDLFPGVEVTPMDYSEFETVLYEELKLAKLQSVPGINSKVIQLFETKSSRHGVMIVGESGVGKSTMWTLLQSTLTKLALKFPDKYNSVKSFPLNPKSLSLAELYGEFNIATNEWTDGVLSNVMRAACADEKKDLKWIVFDGPVDTLWIESMNTVLDDNKVLTLINGERIALPEQVSLLFEVENLSTASPATVSRCGMIYMDYVDLGWRPFIDSWLDNREQKQSVDILKRLIERYVPACLEFKKSCSEIVAVSEASAIRSLATFFDCVATRENNVDPSDPESYPRIIELWFLFSVIWTIGGSLTEQSRKRFDMFLREIDGQFPSKDTVFEYYVDKQNKTWLPWEDKLTAGWKYANNTPFYKIFVPTIDTVRNEFVVKSLISKRKPILLVGEVGVGKTSLIQSVLQSLSENEAGSSTLFINSSAQTSSNMVQSMIESRLEKRTKNVFAPIGGKQLTTFIDDFNMPMKDTFGSQPPLELIRHWMDYGFVYDRSKQSVKYLNDILMIAAMGPPGGGRNAISQRIQSRFCVLNMTFPQETSIQRIYRTIIDQKLQDFEEDVKPLAEMMTNSTIEIYHIVAAQLLPTPSKIHYLFNMRDISKVFQGLLRANREYYDSRESITKLWIHEMMRVFQDRLVDKEDCNFLVKLVDDKLNTHFSTSLERLECHKRLPIFGDVTGDQDNPIYEEIPDMEKLKLFAEEKLEEYNTEPGFVQINLVLFNDAIGHVLRISRILRLLNGNVLLVGVGGSGRQSLARLASYMVRSSIFQIKITKYYRHLEFREDLKKLYRQTGVDGKVTTFLLTDSQIISDNFLEDISNILSSGQVPGLFTGDELTEIKQTLKSLVKQDRMTDEATMTLFIERVRSNLHVILCMSPVGDAFRTRLRMFPSLVNCTTINWFSEWPEDALLEVAIKYLDGFDLGSETIKKSVSQMFVSIHMSVLEYSAKMISEIRRYNYVTPINYLELVKGYRELLKEKRIEIGNSASKLRNGLSKLDDTRESVEKISIELEVAKKQVAQFQKQCEDYLVVIVQQKREADDTAKSVQAKAEKMQVEEEEVRGVAESAQADLDLALPALNAAVKALDGINKKDLNEMRSYTKPPPLVEKVMEAVMVLKKCEPTWDESKRQLGNPYFLKQLVNFDKDNISDKILKRTSQYCADENFQPEVVGRVSGAAKSLCMWVKAMETYGIIFRQVAPKKEKLRLAQETLEKKQKTLKEAKARLDEIQQKLLDLKNQYDEKVALKEKLRSESESTELKLVRAEKLVTGLSGEKSRWEISIKRLEEAITYLTGDCLLAAAFLSYAGPFNSTYRQQLLHSVWLVQVKTLNIPFSPNFSLDGFLGKATELRDWNIQGLPSDEFSSENGIIVTRGRRWPLMIDPQGQANKWIRKMEGKRDLKIIDLKQSDYMRTLENAIQYGLPVLLQGVLEAIDPALDPILNKSIIKKGGVLTIKLGEKEVEFNPDFKFYLTTKLANPKYPPEIFAKATIINFAVKERGLEDQLLAIVVRREKPDLEEQKNSLVINMAAAKNKLVELEDEILYLLATAQGSLLDDEKLVNTLQSSKTIAEEVTQQLIISEQTEKRIDIAREAYRPSAQRASILFFVLNDMASIDPMYQFSLDAYIELFENSIVKSKKFDDPAERNISLNDYHTYSVYKNTCRGLFEEHKLLFSLQMTVKILEEIGKLNRSEYDFFLRGGQVLDRESQPVNACSEWLNEATWDNITELDTLPAFSGIVSSLEQGEREWKSWFTSGEPDALALPGEWDNKLNDLQKMVVVRSLRPDRVSFCAQAFVVSNLGQKFVEPPILDVGDVLADSTAKTPLVFVLSAGVDPTSSLIQLAHRHGMSERFHYIALGQGQAPKAIKLIQEGLKSGDWVFLANCHLSISFMPTLDKIIESIPSSNPHKDFRLWLSSSPHPQFPISILQSSLKMTTEPPKGLKANLNRLYCNMVTDDSFGRCTKNETYKKLLFSLSFFHSVLIERKKFLTLGWNVVCDFNDSDFEICENLMVVLLDEYPQVPWDALKYLIAEANYGGRVTDDWDRRVLRSYINHYFCDEALTTNQYLMSSLPTYYIPDVADLSGYRDYVIVLPGFDKPELFGQHGNADIASQIKESSKMLQSLLMLQPQISASGGLSREEKVYNISADILKKIPEEIDYEATYKNLKSDMNPLNVVLLQELKRYNDLLAKIRKSLEDLQKGLKGIVVMTNDLEESFIALFEGRIPPLWNKAYPSLKPLAAWTRDLIQRIEYFSDWVKNGEPKVFWLAAFTFPTGFLTAILQKAARKNNIPIDQLSWEFTVLSSDEDVSSGKEGVIIRNLYLEGASWDRKNGCLKEPKSMELITSLPPIIFKPVETKKTKPKGVYVCPLYYYPVRSGSRERPSFVISMELKTGAYDSDFYVKRGTAVLASLA